MKQIKKINLGCGDYRFAYGWVNIDIRPPRAEDVGLCNLQHDLRKGIPFESSSVDVVYSSHFLEHLEPFRECEFFLQECWRILRPNGIIRLSVPDFRRIAKLYLEEPKLFYAEYGFNKPWFDRARTWNRRIGISVMFDHKMLYDFTSLTEVLEAASFIDFVEVSQSSCGYLPNFVHDEIQLTHAAHSLVVDAKKSALTLPQTSIQV